MKATARPSDVAIGRITGLFGLRGELKCDPTPAGLSLFSAGASLAADVNGVQQTLRIESARPHKGRLLVRFTGIDSATDAQGIVGARFFAPRDRIELREGEFLDDDLIGCAVEGVDGRSYGLVERVEHFPSNDMLIVDGRMLPMVRAFVRSIDLAAKRIVVDVPPGLLDDDSETDAPG